MRINQLFAALVFVAGVHSLGCMTDASDSKPREDDHTASHTSRLMGMEGQPDPGVSTGVRCSNMDWQITFWAESQMINPVGTMTCSCWQLEDLEGQTSQWSSLNYEDTCDTQ